MLWLSECQALCKFKALKTAPHDQKWHQHQVMPTLQLWNHRWVGTRGALISHCPGSLFLVTPVMFYWHEYFGGCHHLLGNCISDLSSPGTLSIYLHLQWVPRQTLRLPEVELLHLKKGAEQWLAAAMQMNTDLQGKYHYLVHREINVLGAKKENMAVMLGNSFPSLFRKLGWREAVPHFGILIWDFEMFYIILCLY